MNQEPGDLGYNGFPVSLFYLTLIDADGIADPNVTIALKNLPKKNAVTKEKRLAEFLKMLQDSTFDVRDYATLQCWLQLYPRVAIDTSKAVRGLAHQIQATYMELYGAKDFSRYLKSSMPVWLQGLFDEKSLAQAVRADLLRCFTDQDKVDTKIWVIFQEQIVNYCYCVLVHESANTITDERSDTADEVAMKYDRAMTGALSMLLKIMRLVNGSRLSLGESAAAQIEDILLSEKLWDCLGSSSSGSTMNNGLLRALLAVVSELFALDAENPTPFAAAVPGLKAVYKLIAKKFIKNVKLSAASVSSSLVLSSVIIPVIDTLAKLTKFPDTAGKKCTPKIKKNIWQIGGAKSYTRFKEYVKLGCCNSDPIYYHKLEGLFTVIEAAGMDSDAEFLDFSSTKDAKSILIKLLLPQVTSHRGLNAYHFKLHGAKCIFAVFELFKKHADPAALAPLGDEIFFSILDSVSGAISKRDEQAQKVCLQALAAFGKSQNLDLAVTNTSVVDAFAGEKLLLGGVAMSSPLTNVAYNYSEIVSSTSTEAYQSFLGELIEKIEEIYETAQLEIIFSVIYKIYTTSEGAIEPIEEWVSSSLVSFVSEEFVDSPLRFLNSAIKRGVLEQNPEILGDFYSKIVTDAPQSTSKFMLMVSGLDNASRSKLQTQAREVLDYVTELSKKSQRSNDEEDIVLSFLSVPAVSSNLLEHSPSEAFQRRIIAFLAHSDVIAQLDDTHLKTLSTLALKNSNEQDSRAFLQKVSEKDFFGAACFDVIRGGVGNVTEIAKYLAHLGFVPKQLLRETLMSAIGSVDLHALAIANALDQNVYLFEQPAEVKLDLSVLSIHTFLTAYVQNSPTEDDELKILHALSAQYKEDYWFLNSFDSNTETIDPTAFLNKEAFSVSAVFTGSSSGPYAQTIQALDGKGSFGPYEFYVARLILQMLREDFDHMSLAEFESLDIPYVKLGNSPLKLATFLACAFKFIGKSSKLDRIRNFVFGEILGVRSSAEILHSGKTWICLAVNFLNGEDPYSIIPNPKLGLLINKLASWLESDIAFDSEFNSVRCLLAIFLSRLMTASSDPLPDRTWEVSVDLCLNNLATAQVDYSLHALKYFSMKLFLTLTNNIDQAIFPQWKESKNTIVEELIELLFNASENENAAGQSAHLVNELLARILRGSKLPKRVLAENASKFYRLLAASKQTTLQRVATMCLEKHISETQQEVILEYSLRRTNLEDDPDFSQDMIRLDESLITTISEFHHFENDVGDYSKLLQYLWSFLLIFDHFKDSTFTMKAEYISQLKQNNNIEKLFDTIIDIMPVTDVKYLNSLSAEPVDKAAKVDPENCLLQNYDVARAYVGRSPKEEAEFLLAHTYYLSFHYLGAFAEQWYNDIRDLQLKQQVQKFSVRFISPILISGMLSEVENAKEKLTLKDENLSIKVNKITNEIKSVYLIDEQIMEMVVKIPETFPLSKVSVEGPLRLGVKENQWKAWLLASQRVITLTNGSIIDCIEIFNKNVNLHFSGFEECAICYSILHQDHSLPSKNCPVCSNKFHAACLYKWFKSSGSSTCPLCRSAFNFKPNRD